jgi:serine/threonine protein kinase
MAEVFKAKAFGAEGFERTVAIKRILPHLVEDRDFVEMFIDEAKIAVRLQHPNIVAIHDLGRAGGTLYIAMELVSGKDLRAVFDFEQARGGAAPVSVACHVVMKMCEALHHAHFAAGPQGEPLQIIHRDVSPHNVLLSFDGEVKVADFGLAKARGRMVQTEAGVVKGKLAYMSPEQLRGDDIDHRVDVFVLGIVLFELLTGRRLFLGSSDMDTLRRVHEARVPPLQALNPAIHPDLEAIVRRALARDRDQRYATALDLHDDLQFFAYAHGCYGGSAELRRYLREAFPDAAPFERDDVSPYGPAARELAAAARPTASAPPPPSARPAPSGPSWLDEDRSALLAPNDAPVMRPADEVDGPATDRVPAREGHVLEMQAVVARPVIPAGAPPSRERSSPMSASPSHRADDAGLDEDDGPTAPLSSAAALESFELGAVRLAELDASEVTASTSREPIDLPWDDDEPTTVVHPENVAGSRAVTRGRSS